MKTSNDIGLRPEAPNLGQARWVAAMDSYDCGAAPRSRQIMAHHIGEIGFSMSAEVNSCGIGTIQPHR